MFSEELLFLVVKPYLQVVSNTAFLSTQLTESFSTYITCSCIMCLLYSMPVLFYQLWCFFIPSCSNSIRISFLRYGVFSLFLFLSVLWISIGYLLPVIWLFFAKCTTTSSSVFVIDLQPRISDFSMLTLKVCFLFCVCSQIPLWFLYGIDKQILKQCIDNRRIIWFCCVLFGALLAPPEWQIIASLCLVTLTEITILFGYIQCEYKSPTSPGLRRRAKLRD